VFGGYLNRPEETERAFTDDKWFRTGDLGYFDEDGYLHITGRLSTMIVTEGGENVQPDDVERAYEQHPLISEIGVLERDRKLVALVVPDPETMSRDAGEAVTEAVQNALRERSAGLPSYMRISTVRVTRNMLPRTRLGKIRRHQLEQRYEEAGQETEERSGVPMSVADMSDQDQALLENRTARQVWDWLCERYPDRALSPDTSPQLDLGVDSMEWLNLTLEIRERTGAEIDERAVERVSTVRDLLSEAAEAGAGAGAGGPAVNPVESPYEVLGEEEQRWLRPLSAPMRLLRWLIYMVGSGILRLFCSITVKGREHLPAEGAFVIAPNHASYLDPFLLGHVLGLASFRKTHWAGATDAAFDTALKRIGCRLGRVVPITPERGAVRALAFAAAVLQKGKRLVWFPEGRRSPDGTLLPLKPGLARVLREIDVPVVPVWLAGTHEAWPVNRRWPRPGALDVVFGKPLSVADLQAAGEGDDPDKQITDGLTRKLRELRDSLA
jgi:long-chain acyl-CoA synthetase